MSGGREGFRETTITKAWRIEAASAARKGTLASPSKETFRDAAIDWLEKAERGEVLSKRKTPYKPSVLRGYRRDLELVLDDLGAHRVSDVRHQDLQALVDRLVAAKLSGSRVRNVIVPVQAFYRHAKKRGLVDFDPSDDLELPESDGSTEWDGTPDDVRALLDPLDEDDEALCATAAYGGLRTGELRALRVSNVHGLDGGECWIEVEHGWDPIEGEILPKSKAGVRAALMPDTLRAILAAHVQRTGRTGNNFLLGTTADAPFSTSYVRKKARKAVGEGQTRAGDAAPAPARSSIAPGRGRRQRGAGRPLHRPRPAHGRTALHAPAPRSAGGGRRSARALPHPRGWRRRPVPHWRIDWRRGSLRRHS